MADPGAAHEPAAHGAHATVALVEEVPLAQGEHVTAPPAPATGTVPDTQVAHAATELDPAGDVMPAPHATHSSRFAEL